MNIFGVGIGELVFIFLIAIIILGPDGMVKTAATLGKSLRKIIHSPIWATLMNTQRELRDVPTRIVREAGMEEDLKELRKTSQEIRNFRLDDKTLEKLTTPTKSEPVAPAASSAIPPTSTKKIEEPQVEADVESQPAEPTNTIKPENVEEKTE